MAKGGADVGVMTFFDGPMVDGEILDRSPRWQALVHTETTARVILMGDYIPIDVDGVGLRNIEPCEEHEYRFLVADAGWTEVHAPDRPEANPRQAVNWLTLKPRF